MTAPVHFTPPTFNHIPPGPASTLAINNMRLGVDPIIKFVTPGGRTVWHLGGGKAPTPGAEPGLSLQQLTGMDPPIKLIDLQGARQHGVTNTDMLLDPMELDFVFTANAPLNQKTMLPDPNGMRRIMRWWMESWAGNRQGKLWYITPELGHWWATVRKFKSLPDQFKISYSQTGEQTLTWSARADDAHWWSFDSRAELWHTGAGTTSGGWLGLANRGTEDGWPRILFYGPGSFQWTEPDGTVIEFGPLLDGQVALISTRPGLRTIIDVTPSPLPPQQLNQSQQLLADVIKFVTNNNTPPLFTMLESWAGIMPPQGQLYGLLRGRWSKPLPGVEEAQPPTAMRVPITIKPGTLQSASYGGPFGLGDTLFPPAAGTNIEPIAGKTRVVAAVTPGRIWPE